jgi:glycosyltransferase involved in cell wall biosynthesis
LVLGNSAGGIATHVAFVAGALGHEEGLDIDIAGPPDLPVAMPRAVKPLLIPDGPLLGHRAAAANLRNLLATGRYDVVHAHGLRAGIDSGVAARGLPISKLATVHNLVQPEIAGRWKAPLYRRSESLVVRMNDKVLAVSEQIASTLRGSRSNTKVEVLHLGVGEAKAVSRDRDAIRAELGVPSGAPLIVTAARLAPQKDVGTMLRAVAGLPGQARLAIVGEGPDRSRLSDEASTLGISDRVAFLGWRDDLQDHLAAADVFCLSSIWEGVPLAAQEAILAQTPVVATAVGGMQELITDGVSGRLVAPRDPAALRDALSDVLSLPDRGEALARSALLHLQEDFSTDKMLARLKGLYVGAGR